jgi:hypothetical protein
MPEIYVATEEHVVHLRHGGTMKIPVGYWVGEGHELMAEHPDKWRVGTRPDSVERSVPLLSDGSAGALDDAPADSLPRRRFDGDEAWQQWLTEQGSASSNSAAGPLTMPSRSIPDVQFHPEATPRVVVQLSAAARRDLDRQALTSRPRTISAPRDRYAPGLYEDGVESGGYLFGRFTRDALADVDLVIGAGANAVCTPNSVTFDAGDRPAFAFENDLRDVFDNRDTRLVGDWHVHPNGGEGQPSSGDLRSWALLLERIREKRNASCLIGLIGVSTGGDGSLFRVGWHAWVVQRTPGGRLICEPACLEGQR